MSIKQDLLTPDQESYFLNHINDFACEIKCLYKKRLKSDNWYRFYKGLALLYYLILFLPLVLKVGYTQSSFFMFYLYAFLFIPEIMYIIKARADKKACKYRKKAEDTAFPSIFKYFGGAFVCSRKFPRNIEEINQFKLTPYCNKHSISHYIQGTYKDIKIEVLEVKLKECSKEFAFEGDFIVFDGILLLLTPKNTVPGSIVIRRTDKRLLRRLGKPKGMQVIHPENPKFGRAFNVYADDQIEARTLLTNSFMQRLLNLDKRTGLKQVDLSVHSGKVLIRIPTKHHYFPIIKTGDLRHNFKAIIDDMQSIFDIIDALQLDLDIGL